MYSIVKQLNHLNQYWTKIGCCRNSEATLEYGTMVKCSRGRGIKDLSDLDLLLLHLFNELCWQENDTRVRKLDYTKAEIGLENHALKDYI